MRRLIRIVAAALLPAMPALADAQSLPDTDYQADRHSPEYAYDGGMRLARSKPWTFSFFIPLSWQSNIGDDSSGMVIDPEWTLARDWSLGALKLSTTGAIFLSVPEPDPAADVSGWYATIELSAGDPAAGLSPYLQYEPVAVHAGVLGANLLTRHNIRAGVRRVAGPVSLDLSAVRAPTNVEGADRTAVQFSAIGNWRAGSTGFQLRGDLEQRWYDRVNADTDRREITRLRIRARAIIPLDPAVDLLLNAQWERHWANNEAWEFSNITIGPTLVARFGF